MDNGFVVQHADDFMTQGNECWCDHWAPFKVWDNGVDMSECNLPCTGDNTTTCGGANRINVWSFVDKRSLERVNQKSAPGPFEPVYTIEVEENPVAKIYMGSTSSYTEPAYTVTVVRSASPTVTESEATAVNTGSAS